MISAVLVEGPTLQYLELGILPSPVNNRNHVVGTAVRLGNMDDEAFIWTRETGMVDLGRLEGDTNSAGLGINGKDEVVGGSINGDLLTGDSHPFLCDGEGNIPNSTYLLSR